MMRTVVRGLGISGFVLALSAGSALAAQCGNTGAGFEAWKTSFARQAAANGIGKRGLSALAGTRYATGTIRADRNQHSFKLSLGQFMAKRGASSIVAAGRAHKRANAALFERIEAKYGVPAGPLIAIWGMETGFGRYTGSQNTVSAIATLAYDCRRSAFFTDQLYAALKLVDRGVISSGTRGAMHGEIGQTQFMPKNVLLYGGGGSLASKESALTSTARFLVGHGWRRGAGYQPGQANFGAIQGWNAASVYQQAIAIMGRQIDGE
jgi:membrane-bound lytic murein transglycosylase B